MTAIQTRLFEAQDIPFREFNRKLLPTLEPDRVIGVRTPILRALAKELSGTAEAEAFLTQLPHSYFEEDQLHGFLLERIRDYDRVIAELDRFLPWVNNWATCDALSPSVFHRHLPQLKEQCKLWLSSPHLYARRFGVCMLMKHFLKEQFFPEALDWVSGLDTGEYYIHMVVAWYFATALAFQWERALPYLTEQQLDQATHNKTIQKAVESYRISPEQKEFLRTLRIK